MRAAPAHLESKLRFWDLSVGQIAAAFAGIMLGVAWAKFLSPLHGMWGAMSGAYIAALPVVPVFVASQTELDLGGLLVGAIRWRRLEGRYLPGAGETAQGYLLSDEHADSGPGEEAEVLERELAGSVGRPASGHQRRPECAGHHERLRHHQRRRPGPRQPRVAEQRKREVMIVNRTARRAGGGLPAAGELLAVEAIDRTGLIVTSEGALVRIFRVTPRNPLLMSVGEREKTAAAFQRLLSQLGADETCRSTSTPGR